LVLEALTRKQRQMVQAHLKTCKKCQALYQSVDLFSQALSQPAIKPRPDILQHCIQSMEKTSLANRILVNLAYAARKLVTARLPLYQAALIVVLIFGGNRLIQKYHSRGLISTDTTLIEDTLAYSNHIKEHLDMIRHQNIGTSLKEDTTIIDMFVDTR
jgi:predicted anti-sigma-YlaC factor YlaD